MTRVAHQSSAHLLLVYDAPETAATQHTTTSSCSTHVVDVTIIIYQLKNITSLRVVQQQHYGTLLKHLLLQATY
jgi:hypothetical protein